MGSGAPFWARRYETAVADFDAGLILGPPYWADTVVKADVWVGV